MLHLGIALYVERLGVAAGILIDVAAMGCAGHLDQRLRIAAGALALGANAVEIGDELSFAEQLARAWELEAYAALVVRGDLQILLHQVRAGEGLREDVGAVPVFVHAALGVVGHIGLHARIRSAVHTIGPEAGVVDRVGIVRCKHTAADDDLPVVPVGVGIAAVAGKTEVGIDCVAAGGALGRTDKCRLNRVLLRHGHMAALRLRLRNQRLVRHSYPLRDLISVVAGEHGGQVLTGLALWRFAGQRKGQKPGFQCAELRSAAAPEIAQLQREALFSGLPGGDQLDGDRDLVDGAGKGQRPFFCGIVQTGFGGPVHGLIVDAHAVAGAAGAADRRLSNAGLTVHREGGHREAQSRGLALVVVGDHQRQRVAQVAELTALAAGDREQAELWQLGERVVERRHPKVLHGFAVGKGQIEGVHVVVAFKFHNCVAGLLRKLQRVRNGACGRPRREALSMQRNGAEQIVLHRQNAAEVQLLPACDAEDAVVLPGQLQRRLGSTLHVLPEAAGGLVLPAEAACLLRVLQTEHKAVCSVSGRMQADAGRRQHVPLLFGQADLLIGCQGIRIFSLDQKILLAGRGVVIDCVCSALVCGDGRRIADPDGGASDGAADTVDRQQRGLRDRLAVGGQASGLRHVRLIGAKGKAAVGIGFVPVLVCGNFTLRGDQAHRLLSLPDGLRKSVCSLRPNLQRQNGSE